MIPFPVISSGSDFTTVTVASAQFTTIAAMQVNQYFLYSSNTASWIKQGANPTASAAAGSMFVPAGFPVVICGQDGAKLATIRDTADGKASLTPVRM
jgi:hypothetical protein